MNRAYSTITLKAVDDDKRILTGVATTPTVDRVGDVVEPKGAEFKLPIPFLWQHDSRAPVGNVTKARVTKDGIEVEIRMEKTDTPGLVKDRLDAAWQDIKLGLVRGLSIGFQGIESAQIDGTYGIRFLKWLWLELSAVTIAANGDASIQTIKSIDTEVRAALGIADGDDRLDESRVKVLGSASFTDTSGEPDVPAAIGKKARVVKLDEPTRARVAPFVIRSIKRN